MMFLAWTQFLLLAAVIGVAGFWLSRFGDAIAERTGVSGGWIGLGLMATVTSLPELTTGLSAVRIANAPELAVGGALGSCLFNLLLLCVVDLFHRPAHMFVKASQGHALSAGFGAVLLALVGLNIEAPVAFPWPRVSLATVLIIPIYLLSLRTIFTFERRQMLTPAEPTAEKYPGLTVPRAVLGYTFAAAFVVASGFLLPSIAVTLAETMGWSQTFVGSQFLAVATSLPELVVTVTAVRIGVLDMALANLLGSNLFNVLTLAVDDLAYTRAPLLSSASHAEVINVLTGVLMNGIVIAGLIYRPAGRAARTLSWASVALIVAYVGNSALLAVGVGARH